MTIIDDIKNTREEQYPPITGSQLSNRRASGIDVHSAALVENFRRHWFINLTLSDAPDRRLSLCVYDTERIKTYTKASRALDYVLSELEPMKPVAVIRRLDTWPATSAFLLNESP